MPNKKIVLDPQGKTIQGALKKMGYKGLEEVRQGKYFELTLDGGLSRDEAQVVRHHHVDARLLQHHLAHPGAVRVARFGAPRQVAPRARKPRDQRPGERGAPLRGSAGCATNTQAKTSTGDRH